MDNPLILALETATDVCSVALMKGNTLLAIREETGYIHSTHLAVFIKDCLKKANVKADALDVIAVSIGPGSYTGLRVGLSTAKAICYTQDIPLIAISTNEGFALQSIQQHTHTNGIYLPMIDARRMEVYVAAYEVDRKEVLSPEPLILNTDWFEGWDEYDHIILSGDGSEKANQLKGLPSNITFSSTKTSARYIAEIALDRYKREDFKDIAYLEPEYVKPANVTRSKKKLL